jgi:Plasmid pRiA4b ORF-3-like protein
MTDPTQFFICQLRAALNGVSPVVWRRLQLSSETSLADLHKILQLAFGWSDFYLYEFRIHGKTFGSNAEDPHSVCLGDFQLRPTERLRYRYNFLAFWESDLRLETIIPLPKDLTYPRCVGGRHPAPDEDHGGAWEYQRLQDHYKFPPLEALSVLAETAQSVFSNGSRAGIDLEELEEATHRVEAYLRFRDRKFDRQRLNRELSKLNRSGGAK